MPHSGAILTKTGRGMIILLNGTSSAGKTTLARALQERHDGVLLLYGVDTLVQGAFPAKCDAPPWDARAIRLETETVDGEPRARLRVSPYMYPVYRTAVEFCRSLSARGYDVVVDEVLFDANRIDAYFELLADQTVHFVAVKPEREVVVRRERERADRVPGLAAGLYDVVYDPLFEYDLVLDTGRLSPQASADTLLTRLREVPRPSGFAESARRWQARRPH